MSTRSLIGYVHNSDKITYIYCHSDGYPSGVGATLARYYSTIPRIKQLIALGDISTLGPEIGQEHDFMAFDQHPTWVRAYHRDRHEDWNSVKPKTVSLSEYRSAGDEMGAAYMYIYNFGRWAWQKVNRGNDSWHTDMKDDS